MIRERPLERGSTDALEPRPTFDFSVHCQNRPTKSRIGRARVIPVLNPVASDVLDPRNQVLLTRRRFLHHNRTILRHRKSSAQDSIAPCKVIA